MGSLSEFGSDLIFFRGELPSSLMLRLRLRDGVSSDAMEEEDEAGVAAASFLIWKDGVSGTGSRVTDDGISGGLASRSGLWIAVEDVDCAGVERLLLTADFEGVTTRPVSGPGL
jgi:hypothetical protein